jgi:hypothetical protein
MHYRIAYLTNGQRADRLVTASTAVAAVTATHTEVTGDGASFELLSVMVVADAPEEQRNLRLAPA